MERAVDPMIDPADLPGPMIDICGTGGDGLDFFNVSTTIMFVLAAGGAVVVKHGNRSVTSACGSADVLEELGVPIRLAPEELKRVPQAPRTWIYFRATISSGVSCARGNARASGPGKMPARFSICSARF